MNDENITVISSCRDKNVPLWAIEALCAEGCRGQVVIKTRLFGQLEPTVKRLITAGCSGCSSLGNWSPLYRGPLRLTLKDFCHVQLEHPEKSFRVFYCPSTSTFKVPSKPLTSRIEGGENPRKNPLKNPLKNAQKSAQIDHKTDHKIDHTDQQSKARYDAACRGIDHLKKCAKKCAKRNATAAQNETDT
ncbi:TPA: hypothetical protein ACWCGS_005051 [Escherichia coli]